MVPIRMEGGVLELSPYEAGRPETTPDVQAPAGGMGEGASANGVGVLYCCAEPNIHMNGVTVPAAYAVRSSPDYVWGPSNTGAPIELPTVQWAIGPDAAFHWNGLGLLPYKDTFISNVTSTQKGGLASWVPSKLKGTFPSFAGYHETGAATHALMALLSMAQARPTTPLPPPGTCSFNTDLAVPWKGQDSTPSLPTPRSFIWQAHHPFVHCRSHLAMRWLSPIKRCSCRSDRNLNKRVP